MPMRHRAQADAAFMSPPTAALNGVFTVHSKLHVSFFGTVGLIRVHSLLSTSRSLLSVSSFSPVLHFMGVSALTHLSIKYIVVGQHKSAQK